MSFYSYSSSMSTFLENLIQRFEAKFQLDLQNKLSITWICYKDKSPESLSGIGAGWLENKLVYPASVVKLFYACAVESWLDQDLLVDCAELRRALEEMIIDSSNDATSYILDLLTATTSGPSLKGSNWEIWKKQRNLVNNWLQTLKWSELKLVNCCQKTWGDGPFGREKDFYGIRNENRNSLNSVGTAKFFEALMTGSLLKAKSTKNMKRLLFRSLDSSKRKMDPENQIDGFLGQGLPEGSQLWSKAGYMSEVRHDAAWFITPKGQTMLLVLFLTDPDLAKNDFILPYFAKELSQWRI